MRGSLGEIAGVFAKLGLVAFGGPVAHVAALGLIAAVALQLGLAALVDPITISIALVSFVVLLRAPLAAPLLVIAGGVVGVLLLR